ncbi:MAG: hypothetical protein R3B98_04735 [Hyphomonas sp.]
MSPTPHPFHDKTAGVLFLAMAGLTVLAMLHHPTIGAHDPGEAIGEALHETPVNNLVHGSLIAWMIVSAWGATRLAARASGSRIDPGFGALVYAFGAMGMISAAIVSGFAVPDLAVRLEGAPPEEAGAFLIQLRGFLALNQAFAKFGALASGAGIFLLSAALAHRPGIARLSGFGGLAIGALVCGLMLSGFRLNVAGMTHVTMLLGLWYALAGVVLLSRPRG